MTLYEYRCADCGRTYEYLITRENRDAPFVCHCGGLAGRVITAPAIRGATVSKN